MRNAYRPDNLFASDQVCMDSPDLVQPFFLCEPPEQALQDFSQGENLGEASKSIEKHANLAVSCRFWSFSEAKPYVFA